MLHLEKYNPKIAGSLCLQLPPRHARCKLQVQVFLFAYPIHFKVYGFIYMQNMRYMENRYIDSRTHLRGSLYSPLTNRRWNGTVLG